jgi:hypothetical protein
MIHLEKVRSRRQMYHDHLASQLRGKTCRYLTIIMTAITAVYVHAFTAPVIETEGCFALNSLAANYRITLLEKVGLAINNNFAITVCGEQSLRNNSFTNSIFTGMEYRPGRKLQVPLGLFGGISNIHIGYYRSLTPVAGCNSGLIIWLNEAASLRINYLAKLYFDKAIVFGNDCFFGFAFSFLKGPDRRDR